MRLIVVIVCFISTLPSRCLGAVYQLPSDDSRLIGEPVQYQIIKGDYFQYLSEYHNVGLLGLIAANPEVDPLSPKIGQNLVIPKQMLLPYAEKKGIVINLSELRLYYYPPNEPFVYVFPVGIGKEGLSTPKVISYIGDKRKNPSWVPTEAMRKRYRKKHGKELAKVVKAGPNNPFGKYALRIGTSEYLIHGTNQRTGIGERASSGCIRMYAHDIEWLYQNIAVGTQVRIVDQPVKMSYEKNGKKLIEIHESLAQSFGTKFSSLPNAVKYFVGEEPLSINKVQQLLTQPTGLVTDIAIQ